MRIFSTVAFVASLAGCASGPPLGQPGAPTVDVSDIRHEIQHVDNRPIISMGHVTQTSAIVFTEDGVGRREELWQRDATGWKLRDSRPVAR